MQRGAHGQPRGDVVEVVASLQGEGGTGTGGGGRFTGFAFGFKGLEFGGSFRVRAGGAVSVGHGLDMLSCCCSGFELSVCRF